MLLIKYLLSNDNPDTKECLIEEEKELRSMLINTALNWVIK